MNTLTKQGIEAFKSNERSKASNLFQQAVQKDKADQTAWLWLALLDADEQGKAHYLEKARALNPHSEAGKRATAELGKMGIHPETVVSTPLSTKPTSPYLVLLGFICLMVFVVYEPRIVSWFYDLGHPARPVQQAAAAPKPTVVPKPAPNARPLVQYRIYSEYTMVEATWRSVVVPPNTPMNEVTRLAYALHQQNPTIHFSIFDDTSQLDQYIDASINYPSAHYPETWVNQHSIGIVNKMFPPGKWMMVFDKADSVALE